MSYINDIFDDISQTAEYIKCARDAKIDVEDKKLTEMLITPLYAIDKDLGAAAENICMSYAAVSERFGFTMGFRYAMKLMRECDA